MAKVTKQEAGYLGPRLTPDEGTHCSECRDYIRITGECTITLPAEVSGERGTCNLFIKGQPHEYGSPLRIISKVDVGYIEGPTVPTRCARCEYYEQPNRPVSLCSRVGDSPNDLVDGHGCCNLYHGVR